MTSDLNELIQTTRRMSTDPGLESLHHGVMALDAFLAGFDARDVEHWTPEEREDCPQIAELYGTIAAMYTDVAADLEQRAHLYEGNAMYAETQQHARSITQHASRIAEYMVQQYQPGR